MKLQYDLHLHSCLSPCADDEMTPYNLVHMAALLELDIIALTDHNTCGNCRPAVAVGQQAGITVVPGMELCTAEEIHVICLFPDCDTAEAFGQYVRGTLPRIPNKPHIFGQQLYMDAQDHVLGQEDILLVTASSIRIDDVVELCKQFSGVCYPAHIDRASFSIVSNLGAIPSELGFTCAEISPGADWQALCAQHPILRNMQTMHSSDAHRLEDMREAFSTLCLPSNTPQALIESFQEKEWN